MDALSQWAFLAAEILLMQSGTALYANLPPEKIALCLATAEGCHLADNQFQKSLQTIASPALFVYTLPNIMMGEICIKYGFKGEQLCLSQPIHDEFFLEKYAQMLLKNHDMQACLYGWANVTDVEKVVHLSWLSAEDL